MVHILLKAIRGIQTREENLLKSLRVRAISIEREKEDKTGEQEAKMLLLTKEDVEDVMEVRAA